MLRILKPCRTGICPFRIYVSEAVFLAHALTLALIVPLYFLPYSSRSPLKELIQRIPLEKKGKIPQDGVTPLTL